MFKGGLIESGYSESDYNFDEMFGNYCSEKTKSAFPMSYDCTDYCDLKVEDQGNTLQCVAYSLAKVLEFNKETLDNMTDHFSVDKQEIYDSRPNNNVDEGMTVRDALHFVKHNKYNIKSYGRLYSRCPIMKAIFVNGPCIFALPVYDSSRTDFWNGEYLEGGHAVCCVGYNEEGFIILNSWGPNYGNYGKAILPYSQFNKILECWTVIA